MKIVVAYSGTFLKINLFTLYLSMIRLNVLFIIKFNYV